MKLHGSQRFERVKPAFVVLNRSASVPRVILVSSSRIRSVLSPLIVALFLSITLVPASAVNTQQNIALAGSIVLAVVYCGVALGFLIYSSALARQIQQVCYLWSLPLS